MTALAVNHAPSAALPMRYLGMVPVWGLLAAVLLLLEGESLFVTRWALATVAVTHVFTLGVLGNAMLGSLLQFLPVAAGVRLAAPGLVSWNLPVIFNLGLAGLLAGLLRWPLLVPWSGALLFFSIGFHAVGCLRSMRFDGNQTWLRLGMAAALVSLALTATLGLSLTLGLAGMLVIPMQIVTDMHAAIGLLGGVVMLCACVGSVAMPMLQGSAALPKNSLRHWLLASVLALLAGIGLRAGSIIDGDGLAKTLLLPVACFAFAILFSQWKAPHRRNRTLANFWRLGAMSLLAALSVIAFVSAPFKTLLAGVLGIGIGLPSLVIGMLLEIAPFIAWLKLQRLRRQGSRAVSVDGLMPEYRKQRIFILHVSAAIALPVAVIWPETTCLAAVLLAFAHGLVLLELLALHGRTRQFALVRFDSRGLPT